MSSASVSVSAVMTIAVCSVTMITSVTADVSKRSDDASLRALEIQVSQMASQLTSLTAQLTAQQNKVAVLESKADKYEKTVAFFASGGSGRVDTLSQRAILVTRVQTNVGNAFDPQTGFFTAPVSGLYQFTASFMAYDAHYVHAAIYVGSTSVATSIADSRSGDRDNAFVRALVHVSAGQKVHLQNTDVSTNSYYGSSYLTFSGLLIRED